MKSVLVHEKPLSGNGKQKRTTKRITRSQIVGLALIALVTLALGYLHFSGSSGSVSVPSNAHPGQLTLKSCTYTTEDGTSAADCGTLVVPENRHDPSSRLIALPVTRIRAESTHPGVPIFRLQGGPGVTNMEFPDASRFSGKHDVVLVGYRGVDGSVKLNCPEVASSREHSRDLLSERSFRADAAAYRSCVDRLRRNGVDLAGYSIPERVDDLEAARRALGYHQIDLISESAGTRTAMIYAWRYPTAIHRSVMIGVNPPGRFLWDAATTGEQIRRYAAICARDTSCRDRSPDLAASLKSSFADMPDHWLFLTVKKGDAKAAAFFGLINDTSDGGGPIASPRTIDTLLGVNKGDASGAWFLSLMAQLVFPRGQVWGDVAAIGRSDATYARHFFASGANHGSVIGSPGTDLIWAGGRLLDAWPANPDENEYTHVQDSSVETLLIGGNLDVATPPQNATREVLPHLSRGHQVVLTDLGHADDFWVYESEASTRLVNTYLDKGTVDTSLYTHNRIDFTPGFSHGAIAKIVVGVLLTLAAFSALSMLWMMVRLFRRSSFGWKVSATMRSLYAALVGFGGWCIGVLVVLTALPTVPLDDQAIAVVSVGVPVGLAVYCGWVKRDSLPGMKPTGAAAAFGASILGAWLGYHAPATPLLGALTGTLGAVAAANLGLIAIDVARVRERPEVASSVAAAVEA